MKTDINVNPLRKPQKKIFFLIAVPSSFMAVETSLSEKEKFFCNNLFSLMAWPLPPPSLMALPFKKKKKNCGFPYADKNTLHKDKQKISVPNFKAFDDMEEAGISKIYQKIKNVQNQP